MSWRGERFDLRYPLPTIRTLRAGRRFGIYWSNRLRHGILQPTPTENELNYFYDVPSYADYLSGIAEKSNIASRSLLNRLTFKAAYLMDRGVEDPVPSIFRLSSQVAKPTVCDIGCGSGEFLTRMQARGAQVSPSDRNRSESG